MLDEYTVMEYFLKCYDDIHERYYAAHSKQFNKLWFLDCEVYKVRMDRVFCYNRADLIVGLQLLSMQALTHLNECPAPLHTLCDKTVELLIQQRTDAPDDLSRDYALLWRENEELRKKIQAAKGTLDQ